MPAAPALPLVATAAVVLAAVLLLVLLARATARLDVSRAVRIHAAPERVWAEVGHLPDLHSRHAKFRALGRIEAWTLRHGAGGGAPVWRGGGTFRGAAFWTEVEVVRMDPGRVLEMTLLGDSLGTERGLRAHRAVLTLERLEPGMTRLTWTLQAHLRGPRLRTLRLLRETRLRALLLDHGLRSIKARVEAGADEPAPGQASSTDRPAVGPGAAGRPAPPGAPAPAGGGSRPPEAAV
jgi:hypothetical protein